MYYIQINEENGNNIIYYCRNCGSKDPTLVEEGVCVLTTQFKKDTQNFNHIINKYTKLDPTLPRIYNVKCPNQGCRTNAEQEKVPAEVIYIRYDDVNMKYLYMCTECDTTWKTDDNTK
jgi:DNA-directed RNA polymerase subunit M/transcription elongation factor TFIIS